MLVDFFVHILSPSDAFGEYGVSESSAWYYSLSNQFYLDNLSQSAKESDLPVLISDRDILELDLPSLNCFQSKGVGFINKNDESRLRALLKPLPSDSVFRINGAFYGICTFHTAVQLHSLFYQGDFLDFEDPSELSRLRESAKKSNFGNIHYGTVFRPFEPLSPAEERSASSLLTPKTKVFSFND